MLLPERAVLLRFDGGTWSNVADVPSIKGTSDWLVSLPDGTVWGSDPVGLFKVSGRGVGRWDYRWSDLSDTIRDAARDQFGRIWLATSEGARLLNGSTWILFTVEDGLPSNDLTSVSVSADGTLWFGTTDTGVASFTPDSEQTSQTE